MILKTERIEIEETNRHNKKMSYLNDFMDFNSGSLRTALDEINQRLVDCNFGLEDPKLLMFTAALLIAMRREGRGDRSTELVLMMDFGESGTAKRGRNRLMR